MGKGMEGGANGHQCIPTFPLLANQSVCQSLPTSSEICQFLVNSFESLVGGRGGEGGGREGIELSQMNPRGRPATSHHL